MRAQADEEHLHAMRFFDHITDRGARVRSGGGGGATLGVRERRSRSSRHRSSTNGPSPAASRRCSRPADRSTQAFLDWFLTEQVEEEKTVWQIVESLRLAGDSGPALLILDRELGTARQPPSRLRADPASPRVRANGPTIERWPRRGSRRALAVTVLGASSSWPRARDRRRHRVRPIRAAAGSPPSSR